MCARTTVPSVIDEVRAFLSTESHKRLTTLPNAVCSETSHHRQGRIPRVCLDVSTAVYVADRLEHDLTDGENNTAAADATEFEAVFQGLELSELYPSFREKAMEQLAQREGV